MADFDLAIIGGGINGTGIARDAAGRGFRVVLIEQNDLASGTSSASSKLIHGGLRYLEQRQFRLVHEALREREVLLRAAPHLIRPLRFVLPINEARRSPALLRLGLLLYDWIGWRKILPGTRELDLVTDEAGQPLKARFHHAFEYSDCFADNSRLVVLNAVDAAERGAVIRTRTRCVRADRADAWRLVLNARGQRDVITARILVNATGAWSELFAETALRIEPQQRLRLDKGSHIVVRRLYDHDRAYIFAGVRQPRRVRHSVSARLHPDRNHRSFLRRRSLDGDADRRGDRLSVRRGERVFPHRDRRRRRGVGLCRRAFAL